MADPLRVLCVEDVDSDPLLLIDELERGGYEPLWRRVDSIEDFESALSESWDIVIADDSLISGLVANARGLRQGPSRAGPRPGRPAGSR